MWGNDNEELLQLLAEGNGGTMEDNSVFICIPIFIYVRLWDDIQIPINTTVWPLFSGDRTGEKRNEGETGVNDNQEKYMIFVYTQKCIKYLSTIKYYVKHCFHFCWDWVSTQLVAYVYRCLAVRLYFCSLKIMVDLVVK